ncbi:DNA-binding protein [Streptomyces sp. NPDC056500]|uniref:nSTAND1 domain-containing NTPase n=1 Tax=Streptomyces sp. NPDC056500 TaxID=3345840 RepID=UPI0036B6590D
MGRREAPLDPGAGPVQRFAHELRQLRHEADGITYREMSRKADYSVTALSRAAGGEQLPSLAVVLAYVGACGGDVGEWERRWHATAEETVEQGRADDGESPYQGLARFEPSDHERFFGRSTLIAAVSELTGKRRFTAVFGPSGSGKSSLLRAGLVPALRAGGTGLAAIRILTPGEHPLRTHANALIPKAGTGDTLLVVDQFEEVFTLCRDTVERFGFIDRLLSAADPGSRLRVVVAVRADFYSRCAEHRSLADALTDAAMLVGPMTSAELRETIVGPAQAAGLIVERELTARLVAEVEGEPGGLPLLSHALRETWRRRRGRALTMAAYEASGGVHGAISRTAEETFAELSEERRELARLILLRLITPGEDSPDTRRPIDRTELDFGAPTEVAFVVERLARARLLTLNDDTVDLAHEALISGWPRLSGWVEEGRERLRAHRRLTEAAHAWHDLGQDQGGLYRGTRLATAEEHFAGSDGLAALTVWEREFLAASRTARAGEHRRRRVGVSVFAVVMVLALIAGVIAWQQTRVSDRRGVEAEARRIASVAEGMRSSDPKLAMRLSVAAWRLAEMPETRAALLGAVTQREQDVLRIPVVDADVSERHLTPYGRVFVSVERDRNRIESWDLRDPSRRSSHPGPGRLMNGDAYLLSPDGRTLVLAQPDGLVLWDVRAGRVSGRLAIDRPRDVVFSSDGRTLAVKRSERTVEIWDMTRRRRVAEIVAPQGEKDWDAMILSPEGRRLAWCSSESPMQIWDLASRKRVALPWGGKPDSRMFCDEEQFAFLPGGRTVAFIDGRDIHRWDLESGRELPLITAQQALMSMRLSEDGKFIAASTVDSGELLLWRLDSPHSPVLRHALVNQDVADFAVDIEAGALRFRSSSEAAIRSLSLGPVATSQWRAERDTTQKLTLDGQTLTSSTTKATLGNQIRLLETGSRESLVVTGEMCPENFGEDQPAESAEPSRQSAKTCHDAAVFSADGRYIAYGNMDSGRFSIWDVEARQRISHVQTTHTNPHGTGGPLVQDLALSANGHHLYTIRSDDKPTLEIWDLRKPGHARKTAAIAGVRGDLLAPRHDTAELVTSAGDVIDTESGRVEPRTLDDSDAQALLFSPTGTYLAVGDILGRVTVWDGALRRKLAELSSTPSTTAHYAGYGITALAFSPDEEILAVADGAGSVQLWHVATQRHLGSSLPTPGDPAFSVAFSADGHTLYTAGLHTGLHSYDIHPQRLADTVCQRAGSGLTRAEWKTRLPNLPYRTTC